MPEQPLRNKLIAIRPVPGEGVRRVACLLDQIAPAVISVAVGYYPVRCNQRPHTDMSTLVNLGEAYITEVLNFRRAATSNPTVSNKHTPITSNTQNPAFSQNATVSKRCG